MRRRSWLQFRQNYQPDWQARVRLWSGWRVNFPVSEAASDKNFIILEIDLKREDDVYMEEMKDYDYTCRIKEAVRFSALELN